MTRDSKTRFNTYREGITGDREIRSNEEESSTSDDSFFIEKESKEDLRDNETDENDIFKQQDVIEGLTDTEVESELTEPVKNRRRFITSIIDMFISTNVITLKIIHSNSFRKETIKTRIFILQIDNKITNTTGTFEERKIRYTMSLLREMTTK